MTSNFKHIVQMNGFCVMDALHFYREPVSLYKIVKYIGKIRSVDPLKLKEQIEKVIENGVKNGFIGRNNQGRYYVAGCQDKPEVENDDVMKEENEQEDDHPNSDTDMDKQEDTNRFSGSVNYDNSEYEHRRRHRKRNHDSNSRSRCRHCIYS